MDLESRFWAKVDRRSDAECWPWTGSANHKGYGKISVDRRARKATHVSWEIANGRAFPAGMMACHSCDNPRCVNPAHIWPGTALDNSRDCIAKGRFVCGAIDATGGWRVHVCANGHAYPPLGELKIDYRGRRQCRICSAARNAKNVRKRRKPKPPVETQFGHNKLCKKCGHHRTDDYRNGRGWACRPCNIAKSAARQSCRRAKA